MGPLDCEQLTFFYVQSRLPDARLAKRSHIFPIEPSAIMPALNDEEVTRSEAALRRLKPHIVFADNETNYGKKQHKKYPVEPFPVLLDDCVNIPMSDAHLKKKDFNVRSRIKVMQGALRNCGNVITRQCLAAKQLFTQGWNRLGSIRHLRTRTKKEVPPETMHSCILDSVEFVGVEIQIADNDFDASGTKFHEEDPRAN